MKRQWKSIHCSATIVFFGYGVNDHLKDIVHSKYMCNLETPKPPGLERVLDVMHFILRISSKLTNQTVSAFIIP